MFVIWLQSPVSQVVLVMLQRDSQYAGTLVKVEVGQLRSHQIYLWDMFEGQLGGEIWLAFDGSRPPLRLLKIQDTLEFSDLVLTEWQPILWRQNFLGV
jgi:hypothetical protein